MQVNIKSPLYEELTAHSKRTNIPITTIALLAVTEYLERHPAKKVEAPEERWPSLNLMCILDDLDNFDYMNPDLNKKPWWYSWAPDAYRKWTAKEGWDPVELRNLWDENLAIKDPKRWRKTEVAFEKYKKESETRSQNTHYEASFRMMAERGEREDKLAALEADRKAREVVDDRKPPEEVEATVQDLLKELDL